LRHGIGNTVKGTRLALPACVVGEPVVRQLVRPAHQHEVVLDPAIAGLAFLHDSANGCLIEDLAHGARPGLVDDLEEIGATLLDLIARRSNAWALIGLA
jgi:hypothetical protein